MAEFRFNVKIDPSRLIARTAREQKRLAYSVAQAINAATKDVQLSERANLDRKFQIRKAGFMYRLIKIQQFATVGKNIPYAVLGIDNTKDRVLLSVFEDGGDKRPVKGKNVAVPLTGSKARPVFPDPVPESMTFKRLNFKRVALTGPGTRLIESGGKHSKNLKRLARKQARRKYQIWAGQERTFILPHTTKAPHGGVFMRVGPKKDDIRMIYSFAPRPRLKHVLKFVDTARAEFGDAFTRHFDRLYRRGS
jgi:hypothetical protein